MTTTTDRQTEDFTPCACARGNNILCSLQVLCHVSQYCDIIIIIIIVPRISIFNITVLESVGTVTIPINRTGGDISLVSVIRATSRDVPGEAVGKY